MGIASQKDQAIKKALGGKYFSHFKTLGSGKNRFYGIITYSKFPIIKRGEIIHPGSASLSIYTDIIIKKDTFRIFNNHLESFRLKNMERSFFDEMTDSDETETLGEIRRISVSLKKGFINRSIQAKLVKKSIDKSPYPVIVTGDFNDTPVSYSYRRIRKGLNDSFVKSGYGAGFTYKGNYPANRIDYILYDNVLESRSFNILKVKYSDHYPVVAWLKKSN
jgi:endonuclease/exonuclease/phosphatase family metal-dependent hydrolase